jgi:hypothetical protein
MIFGVVAKDKGMYPLCSQRTKNWQMNRNGRERI